MLLNWQVILGRGCAHQEPQAESVKLQAMQLNLMGSPEETRFLCFAALKETYQDDPEVLPAAMQYICEDLHGCLKDGLLLRHGSRIHLAVLNCKGDWPFLIEAGGLLRHYRRAQLLGCQSFNNLIFKHSLKNGEQTWWFDSRGMQFCVLSPLFGWI